MKKKKPEKKGAYAWAGVDVASEAKASRIMYEAARKTFSLRKGLIGEVLVPFDDFAGLRMIALDNLPKGTFASLCFDTAGTKVELAQRVNKHDTIAFDLFAMVCDDAAVRGGEPILIGTNLDLKSLGSTERFLPAVRELAAGYVAAAKAAHVSIINGEIAQMGNLVSGYGAFPYHWGAAALWVGAKEKLITGREVAVGDSVVVLREKGFRCNGWSLVRKIYREAYGAQWHAKPFGKTTLGKSALEPSVIYTKVINKFHGGFSGKGTGIAHGVVHITGGGIPEKFSRVLKPSGYGALLTDLFEPGNIVTHCQELGGVTDREAYSTWNMGQGMAIITPSPEKAVAAAREYGIEAKIAGEIISEPVLRLKSKGALQKGKEISFELH